MITDAFGCCAPAPCSQVVSTHWQDAVLPADRAAVGPARSSTRHRQPRRGQPRPLHGLRKRTGTVCAARVLSARKPLTRREAPSQSLLDECERHPPLVRSLNELYLRAFQVRARSLALSPSISVYRWLLPCVSLPPLRAPWQAAHAGVHDSLVPPPSAQEEFGVRFVAMEYAVPYERWREVRRTSCAAACKLVCSRHRTVLRRPPADCARLGKVRLMPARSPPRRAPRDVSTVLRDGVYTHCPIDIRFNAPDDIWLRCSCDTRFVCAEPRVRQPVGGAPRVLHWRHVAVKRRVSEGPRRALLPVGGAAVQKVFVRAVGDDASLTACPPGSRAKRTGPSTMWTCRHASKHNCCTRIWCASVCARSERLF
jgi:hypothetical protein